MMPLDFKKTRLVNNKFYENREKTQNNRLTKVGMSVILYDERATKRGIPKTPVSPCVDESTRDALSCSNNIVSQFRVERNRKFVDRKEKTGAAPFKLFMKGARNMATKVKTGGVVPISGQYRPAGKKTEVTFVAGKRVPPVATGATTFTLVDKTKHSGGGR